MDDSRSRQSRLKESCTTEEALEEVYATTLKQEAIPYWGHKNIQGAIMVAPA